MKQSKILPNLKYEDFLNHIFPYIYSSICGDLFLEKNSIYFISLENGKIKENLVKKIKGFSVRKYTDMLYVLSSNFLSLENIFLYCKKLYNISNKIYNLPDNLSLEYKSNKNFSSLEIEEFSEEISINFLKEIYDYILLNEFVCNTIISINLNKNHREIYNEKKEIIENFKSIWSLSIQVTFKKEDKIETFYKSLSSQKGFVFLKENWKNLVNFILKSGNDLLKAKEITAGSYTIVCAAGESGTIIHEAVGHALESDFLYNNTSCFSNQKFQKIANEQVNVVDDGSLEGARGSIFYDDEGNESKINYLIKDGIFVGEINDKTYSFFSNQKNSCNSRRENFLCKPIPRMTNTFLLPGNNSLEKMISEINYGIFVMDIGGGQVDISTGDFVFQAKISYLIENGKITDPLKGVMLMGNAKKTLFNIDAIGNDLSVIFSGGTCGKNGQNVPVCVGCPSFRIKEIVIGGK